MTPWPRPPRHRHAGTHLALGFTQVCASPSEPSRTDTVQGQRGRGIGPAGCAVLAHPDLVFGTHAPPGASLWGRNSFLRGPKPCGTRVQIWEPPCAADLSFLSTSGIRHFHSGQSPHYEASSCLAVESVHDLLFFSPRRPPKVHDWVVLSFLQEKLERRLSLSIVLDGLQRGPFELLDSVGLKILLAKTALLTALTSIKRIGDLQVFWWVKSAFCSGRPTLTSWDPGLDTCPRFLPRPSTFSCEPGSTALGGGRPSLGVAVSRKSAPHIRGPHPELKKLWAAPCLLRRSAEREVWLQAEIAHWIVDAIALTYQSQGELCPLGVRAHSTWSVAASYALAHSASPADIRRAAGWATPNTFSRFYSLRVEPVSSHVLGYR